MKNTNKKLLSLILAVIMVLSAIPFTGLMSLALTSGDFEYHVISETDKTCGITKYNGTATDVTIPSEIDGYTVAQIGEWAFSQRNIKKVAIPNSVYLDDGAFMNCSSLEEITVQGSATIAMYTFYGCSSLTTATFTDGIISIGSYAFQGCSKLKEVKLAENADSLNCIANAAFSGCSSLTEITIPDSVTSIYYDAFFGCTSLTNITVSENNPNYCDVDGVLFNKDMSKLILYPARKSETQYTIPKSVTAIQDYAFIDCFSLKTAIFHNTENIDYIEYSGLGFCSNEDWSEVIPIDGFKIYGYRGTAAETYANDKGFEFRALDEIVNPLVQQIRYQKDENGKYAGKFDYRFLAEISNDDFNAIFGSEENALNMIVDMGYVFAAEKNVAELDINKAKNLIENDTPEEHYVKKNLNYLQRRDTGYVFSCIITDIENKEDAVHVLAYMAVDTNSDGVADMYLYFPDVQTTCFQQKFDDNFGIGCPNG